MIVAYTNSPKIAYILASGLLLIGAVFALMTKSPVTEIRKQLEFIANPVPEEI